MSIEAILLLITTIVATIKAYFEWKKVRAAKELLSHTIKSVEAAKNKLSLEAHREFSQTVYKYIVDANCNTKEVTQVVQPILEPPQLDK